MSKQTIFICGQLDGDDWIAQAQVEEEDESFFWVCDWENIVGHIDLPYGVLKSQFSTHDTLQGAIGDLLNQATLYQEKCKNELKQANKKVTQLSKLKINSQEN